MDKFLSTRIKAGWKPFFESQKSLPYWDALQEFVELEYQNHIIYPPLNKVFRVFESLEPTDVRCIIIGQDPYHGPGQAQGLAFSVPAGMTLPPSLRNIFKEYQSDLGFAEPESGDLSPWEAAGVFLINSALTVRQSEAGSHAKKGWETFTKNALTFLLNANAHAGFICFGAPALKTAEQAIAHSTTTDPTVIATPHPSPLSAYRGFFGSKPFTKFNAEQLKKGRESVPWELPAAAQTSLF